MALSFGIHDYIEGAVITAVILLNIVVGYATSFAILSFFFKKEEKEVTKKVVFNETNSDAFSFVQDYRAEQTILSLHALSAPVSKVVRDGRIDSVKAETLVVGDIVQLAVGDIIPADLRLFDGMNASMDEALLTGESLPISKTPHVTFSIRDMPVGDRTNMAYSGSIMTRGRASGIVISTGMETEVGKIAQLLREQALGVEGTNVLFRTGKRFKNTMIQILGLVGTPLQVKLSKFALLLFALAISLAI